MKATGSIAESEQGVPTGGKDDAIAASSFEIVRILGEDPWLHQTWITAPQLTLGPGLADSDGFRRLSSHELAEARD